MHPLGQPFVVENKPGAKGVLGVIEMARATPDGNTLPVTCNPQVYKKATDKATDFAPNRFSVRLRPRSCAIAFGAEARA